MRRIIVAATALAGSAALASCSALPQSPPDLPESLPAAAIVTPSPSTASASDAVVDGFAAAQHTAVRIRSRTCDTFTVGTGFMLDAHTVVTNRHVVEDAATITLSTYDGNEYQASGSVIAQIADLALVFVDEDLEFAAPLADEGPALGDMLDVVGYPLGGPLSTLTGPFQGQVPDSLGKQRDDVDMVGVSAEHGNSGSAVVNAEGDVVGVLYATDENGESFAVTLESLTRFLADESLQLGNVADCTLPR